MARPFGKFRLRVGGLAFATAAAVLVSAALALAAQPLKGRSYSGHLKVSTTSTVTFKISSDGKRVTKTKVSPFAPNKCGSGGPPPKQTSKPASVSSKGKFKATVVFKTSTGKVLASVTVNGTFHKNGGEGGTVHTHLPGTPSCDGSFTYSTKAS